MSLNKPSENEDDLYRIGTVASLTGISVERLRAWERRYDLSPAHKSGKTRFYSQSQLSRLKLIKHLIDLGQPISSLASLNDAQLQERIASQKSAPVVVSLYAPRVGLVGPNLIMLEQHAQRAGHRQRVEVVSRWANMDTFISEVDGSDNPQILILQLPVLSLQPVEIAQEIFPDARIIAIYQFATAAHVSAVQESGTPTLKWPVTWSEIEHLSISHSASPLRAGRSAPRRFSDEELIAIGTQSNDPTHCPEYLIEAINQLNALSSYAASCSTSHGDNDPYASLQTDTSQARAQLEAALAALVGEE